MFSDLSSLLLRWTKKSQTTMTTTRTITTSVSVPFSLPRARPSDDPGETQRRQTTAFMAFHHSSSSMNSSDLISSTVPKRVKRLVGPRFPCLFPHACMGSPALSHAHHCFPSSLPLSHSHLSHKSMYRIHCCHCGWNKTGMLSVTGTN